MKLSTRPFLAVYVAWHPRFSGGQAIATALYEHYRRNLYENVAGGAGLSVVYRNTPAPHMAVPIGIDFDEAETSAIILLIDRRCADDPAWVEWSRELAGRALASGLRAVIFPVWIDGRAIKLGLTQQAVRWDQWARLRREKRMRRLVSQLTYQLCRMLRLYLERLKRLAEGEEALRQYLQKVEIFLSHSKHPRNGDGERIAGLFREHLFKDVGDSLTSFFDVHDIPAGAAFDDVLRLKVKTSAVVAIHTDTYSSREWCRREMIEAKRWNVPLVVADCISNLDERSFPYLGNAPLVRMEPKRATGRIDYVVSLLFDEVLKDFLWRCRVQMAANAGVTGTLFLSRPPELISLAGLRESGVMADATLVYPDPPIGAEETRLFELVAPEVRLRSITEWLAEVR
ncbi:MAG: hypothetical protein QOH49_537 [Acidobacteriota bacterium]|nr:hypothetical protein [Acidobacteriota bacterium]